MTNVDQNCVYPHLGAFADQDNVLIEPSIELRQLGSHRPFYALLQTPVNHTPYCSADTLARGRGHHQGKLCGTEHLSAMRYPDWRLGRSSNRSGMSRTNEPDTVFVIVGDHGFWYPAAAD